MPKRKNGVIRTLAAEAFRRYEETGDLFGLVWSIVDIADGKIGCQGHRDILDSVIRETQISWSLAETLEENATVPELLGRYHLRYQRGCEQCNGSCQGCRGKEVLADMLERFMSERNPAPDAKERIEALLASIELTGGLKDERG